MSDVLGFRWSGHRLDGSADAVTAAMIGVQDTPPGHAAVGLHVRSAAVTPSQVTESVAEKKDLLLVWSLRASPHLVPTADLGVFTAGLRPSTEEGWLTVLAGFANVLGSTGLTATQAVAATVAALPEALDGRELTKRQLGAALQPLVPESLRPWFDPQVFTRFTAMLTRAGSLTGDLCIRKEVWRSTGNPGVVLRAGRIVGTWRPAKKGAALTLTVNPFESVSRSDTAAIQQRAEALAPFRAATAVTVTYT